MGARIGSSGTEVCRAALEKGRKAASKGRLIKCIVNSSLNSFRDYRVASMVAGLASSVLT